MDLLQVQILEDLTAEITSALNHKEEMQGKCMDYAEKYDWNNLVPILEDYYHKSI